MIENNWLEIGKLTKKIDQELMYLSKISSKLMNKKQTSQIDRSAKCLNKFRSNAEDIMLSKNVGDLNVFYGNGVVDKTTLVVAKKTLDDFINEHCFYKENSREQSSNLYNAYERTTKKNNRTPISLTKFGVEMSKRFEKIKSNGVYYIGISLNGDRE